MRTLLLSVVRRPPSAVLSGACRASRRGPPLATVRRCPRSSLLGPRPSRTAAHDVPLTSNATSRAPRTLASWLTANGSRLTDGPPASSLPAYLLARCTLHATHHPPFSPSTASHPFPRLVLVSWAYIHTSHVHVHVGIGTGTGTRALLAAFYTFFFLSFPFFFRVGRPNGLFILPGHGVFPFFFFLFSLDQGVDAAAPVSR
ncbi:hypothetical protein C8Q78DRAFT_996940 [Trametes maxima]|nr:hypothetical protein C8Q78DRAFT_996940 [Trametes maxima]